MSGKDKTMSHVIPQSIFSEKALSHWTPEREAKITGGKNLLVKPTTAPNLLRTLGLLNSDASMSPDKVRKFLQINHMLALLQPQLDDLLGRHSTVRVLDAACGNSFLTLLVAWYLHEHKKKTCQIIGIDRNKKVISQSIERTKQLGWSEFLCFDEGSLEKQSWRLAYTKFFQPQVSMPEDSEVPRPHLTVALHACDTATDAALALGIQLKSDVIAVAPCCQAELASFWKNFNDTSHPMLPVFRSPNLRRETAAHMTDALRLLLLRTHGYETTATEFVESIHTPKNRLILAIRRGNFFAPAEEQYKNLKNYLGGYAVALEKLLSPEKHAGTDLFKIEV